MHIPSGRKRECSNSGFSLIELLTVILVISVLSGILIPTLIKAKNSANSAKCTNQLRQLGAALFLYTQDNDNLLPPVASATGGNSDRWARHIMPYLGSAELGSSDGNNQAKIIEYFQCPLDDVPRGDKGAAPCSYGLSFQVQSGDLSGTSPPVSILKIVDPAKTILIGDRWIAANTVNFSVGIDRGRSGNFHFGTQSNYLFADGHVESLPRENFLTSDRDYWSFER